MNLAAGFAARFAEGFQKTPAILIVLENRLAPIPPVHHVIDRTRIFHSELARHTRQIAQTGGNCQWIL